MITHRFVEGVLCSLLFALVGASEVSASSSDQLLVEGQGTWEAGNAKGQWTGQFAISLSTGTVSGHQKFVGLDEIGSVNVVGSAAGTSFSLRAEEAPQELDDKQAHAVLAGQTSWDSIEGTLSLPNAAIGTWTGHLSLPKRGETRVSEKVRAALISGTPQDVLIEFDREIALQGVRAAQVEQGLHPNDRVSMLALRTEQFAAVKDSVLSTVPTADIVVKKDYPNLPTVFASVKDNDALERLIAHPEVVAVGPNVARQPMSILQSLQLIHASDTHSAHLLGAGAVMAIIDSGVDWTTDTTTFGPCSAGPDPTGINCRVLRAIDTAPNDSQRDAGYSTAFKHGTNVARLALFVAPAASILAYDAVDNGAGGVIMDADVFDAISDVITQSASLNVVAVNMSFGNTFGGRFSDQKECSTDTQENGSMYRNRFKDLLDAGILPVVAAGNDSAPAMEIPACVYGAVSVGAVYDSSYSSYTYGSGCTDATPAADQVTCFSNATTFLSILAPGAVLQGVEGVPQIVGTSFAAPFVTGSIAVIRGSNAIPDDAPECTRLRLVKTGAPITDSRSGVPMIFPRLNVLAAVNTPRVVGDCNADFRVMINELILGVNIALGSQSLSQCPSFDVNGSGTVSIDELISGVHYATSGICAM